MGKLGLQSATLLKSGNLARSSRTRLGPQARAHPGIRSRHSSARSAPSSSAPDAAAAQPASSPSSSLAIVGLVAALAGTLAVHEIAQGSDPLHNDAPKQAKAHPNPNWSLTSGRDHLGVHLWGSNRYKVVAPDSNNGSSASQQLIKKPRYLTALSGQAFRDLALHEKYAVAVTAHGDLLQWGTGYSPQVTVPTRSLRGMNVQQVALTPDKIYARTKKGEVLIVPASQVDQTNTDDGKRPLPSISFFWKLLGYHDPGAHYVTMTLPEDVTKGSSKKIVDIAAGRSHVLALTEGGKALCAAADSQANETGQLGGGSRLMDSITSKANQEEIIQERDIRYDTAFKLVPTLRNFTVRQIAAGDRHSLAMTSEGRVLGWGNNSLGQLALGSSYSFPTIPAPTECALQASYPKNTRISCQKIYAGGDSSYFLVEREGGSSGGEASFDDMPQRVYQDLLAAGSGMYGATGNGSFMSTSQPVRVKTISGLSEWNETTQRVQPIPIHSLSVASTHAAVVLSNALHDPISLQSFGNDVFVFGHNDSYQLGTGKRNNVNIPQHIPPLPYPQSEEIKAKASLSERLSGKKEEHTLDSGTKSHMPHNRLQLAPRDQKTRVEERIVAGYGTTAAYWHTDK